MRKAVLIGAGGHARVLLDAVRTGESFEVIAVIDARADLKGTTFEGISVVGDETQLPALQRAGVDVALLGVGSVDVADTRRRLYERIAAMGFELPVVRHPAAVVSPAVTIGQASVIFANATINPGTRLRANVIVNTAAIIDHDVVIDDHVHIAPGAHVAGGVSVGAGSHVGIGSTIVQGIRIGKGVMVGAGAVVLGDVPDGQRVAGVPARPIRVG